MYADDLNVRIQILIAFEACITTVFRLPRVNIFDRLLSSSKPIFSAHYFTSNRKILKKNVSDMATAFN